jgi:hypothetical protein
MAQGGIAPYLEPRAIRSTSSAHSESDKAKIAALGNLATEVSGCGDASSGVRTSDNPSRCPGSSARGTQTSRVGAACGHAASKARTDTAGRNESGREMSCRCETCSGDDTDSSSLMGQTCEAIPMKSMHRGMRLYRAFNGFEPPQVVKVHHPRVIPPVVVELGELVGVMYRSDKGQPGQPRTYIHRMENPPRLVSNIEGTQLYIVGGSYQVTSRGIEG